MEEIMHCPLGSVQQGLISGRGFVAFVIKTE
jgi:hypothetical protein